MKKNFPGLLTISVACMLSAFSSSTFIKPTGMDSFFWYSNDGTQFLGEGEFPPNGCQALGTNCAKGYTSEPGNPHTDPPVIRVGHSF